MATPKVTTCTWMNLEGYLWRLVYKGNKNLNGRRSRTYVRFYTTWDMTYTRGHTKIKVIIFKEIIRNGMNG